MKFKRNEIVSDLHEAAKSSKLGVCLLNKRAREIEVYNFDKGWKYTTTSGKTGNVTQYIPANNVTSTNYKEYYIFLTRLFN